MSKQYRKISAQEIKETSQHNPQKAVLMTLANATLAEAEDKATGKKLHQSIFHESGWRIAFDTSQGIVGLWSCWLGNQFYLGYPKDAKTVSDQLIMNVLGVEYAKPVLQVDVTAVNDWDYRGEYRDADKPLVKNKAGQIIAFHTRGPRKWATFYGPRIDDNKGRVWIEHSSRHSHGVHFPIITRWNQLEEIYYGHEQSQGIHTEQFSFYNEYAPDGPTADPEAIQLYREKFLELTCDVAKHVGDATAINIDYGFVLVPEQLIQLGYGNVEWIRGRPGLRRGWGEEVVRAEKDTKSGKETIILKSGNSLVPWSTIRRVPYTSNLDSKQLIELLTF